MSLIRHLIWSFFYRSFNRIFYQLNYLWWTPILFWFLPPNTVQRSLFFPNLSTLNYLLMFYRIFSLLYRTQPITDRNWNRPMRSREQLSWVVVPSQQIAFQPFNTIGRSCAILDRRIKHAKRKSWNSWENKIFRNMKMWVVMKITKYGCEWLLILLVYVKNSSLGY